MCVCLIIICPLFIVFSYAVGDREITSPSRDYPKPWLDFLYAEGCVLYLYTTTYLFLTFTQCAENLPKKISILEEYKEKKLKLFSTKNFFLVSPVQ